jgi:hypothetical protein
MIALRRFPVWRMGVSPRIVKHVHSHEFSEIRNNHASGLDLVFNTHSVRMKCAIALIDIVCYEKADIGPRLVSRSESP